MSLTNVMPCSVVRHLCFSQLLPDCTLPRLLQDLTACVVPKCRSAA